MSLENMPGTPQVKLTELYQEVILDHNKKPRNFLRLEPSTHHAFGKNPLCGDSFELFLDVQNGVIKRSAFWGSGCAISKSSASIMTEMLTDRSIEEAAKLEQNIIRLLTQDDTDETLRKSVGKMKIFEGVKNYPIRVKCAALIWRTLEAALKENKEVTISTE